MYKNSDQEQSLQQRQEEYSAARRAGAEAIEIGRETLEHVTRQGEQLHHAQRLADETSHDLDTASRVLRGMTWTGWLANLVTAAAPTTTAQSLSSSVKPDNDNHADLAGIPSAYDRAPPNCRDAAQAVQNYHANLQVLSSCETLEQTETCLVICENMYRVALTKINELLSLSQEQQQEQVVNEDERAFLQSLLQDLAKLRSRQQIQKRLHQQQQRQQLEAQQYQKSRETLELDTNSTNNSNSKKDHSSNPIVTLVQNDPQAIQQLNMQEQHLQHLEQHLEELGNLALNLGDATERQASLIEGLDTQANVILDKSHQVNRRTDRLIQQKAWTKAQPTFQSCICIRHVRTGKYLAVTPKGNLVLQSQLEYESCLLEVWKRQGSIFGLQSRFRRKWMGQSILGNLECRASSFGARQEFETERPWNETPLLCASAGWGTGSYVVVTGKDEKVTIAPTGTVTSRTADLWCLKETT